MNRISILPALSVDSLALPLVAQPGGMRESSQSVGGTMAPGMQDRVGPNTQSTVQGESGEAIAGTGAGQNSGFCCDALQRQGAET